MKFFKSVAFIAIILSVQGLQSQDASGTSDLLPLELLHEDLAIMKSNLERIHAGLYNYSTKEQLDQEFERIKSSITSPLTSIEFYRRIAVLHQFIRNGHTIIIPSEAFDHATATTSPTFPLDIYCDKEQVFILRNNSDNPDLLPGVRIDSINGYSAPQLFLDMSNLWTRDGSNVTFPQGITQRAFSGFYINLIGTPDTYNLLIGNQDGKRNEISLNALTSNQVDQNRNERYGDIHYYWQEGDGDAVNLDIMEGVAHLQIKTCSTSDNRKFGRSIRKQMNQSFKRIADQNIEHLIIDIRNNGGGGDIISRELFKHISKTPFTQFEDSYLITRRIPNKDYYSENIGKMNTFGKLGIKKSKDGNFRLNGIGKLFFRAGSMLKEHKPVKTPYFGQIYTLTNAYSFSAAGEMAALMKQYTNSLFIGEEPGGNSINVVAGETFTLTLPHSKNRVRIPVVHNIVSANVTPADRGVLPDYTVRNTIQDELSGRDAVLEFTLDLISGE